MTQKPLAEKLREKLAFDRAIEKPLREKYRIVECDGPCDSYGVCPNCIEANEMLVGAQEENARLAPYHEAMIEAVAFVYGFRYQSGPLGDSAREIIKSMEAKLNGK